MKTYHVQYNEMWGKYVEAENEDEAYEKAKRGEGVVMYYETEFIQSEEVEDETNQS